jgi:Calcineurin-like phosphoesterase
MSRPFVACIFLSASLAFTVHLAAQQPLSKMPELKPLKGTPSPSAPTDKDHFTFVLGGDNRPAHSGDPQGPVPHQIFADIAKLQPAFVLWTGDTISGKNPGNPAKIDDQYTEFLAMAASGKAAVYNAPGNHEMNDHNNCPSKTMLKLYLKDNDQDYPYGAFTYGNSRFIALNSDDDEGTPPSECDCKHPTSGEPTGFIGKSQMDLLEKDLDDNKDKTHIFIVMHRPMRGYQGNDQLCDKNVSDLTAMFKNYRNVSYVVSGHQHLYYNPQGPDFGAPPVRSDPSQPPYYLVSGGAGAPTPPFYEYLVFTVDGDKVKVDLVKVESAGKKHKSAAAARH